MASWLTTPQTTAPPSFARMLFAGAVRHARRSLSALSSRAAGSSSAGDARSAQQQADGSKLKTLCIETPTRPRFSVTVAAVDGDAALRFTVAPQDSDSTPASNTGARPVSFTVPAGWAVDHDARGFQGVTCQRTDPVPVCGGRRVEGLGDGLTDGQTSFRCTVSPAAVPAPPPTATTGRTSVTEWDSDARRECVVPLAAVIASSMSAADATHDTRQALAAALASLPADQRANAAWKANGYTPFHAELTAKLRDERPIGPSPAIVASMSAVAAPLLWNAQASSSVASAVRLGSFAMPAGTDVHSPAAASSVAAIRNGIARNLSTYGFAVLRDVGVRNGVQLPNGASVESLALGQPYAALAAPSEDPKVLLDHRLAGITALVKSSFGVIRHTHYGGMSTWGDRAIKYGSAGDGGAAAADTGDAPAHMDTAYVRAGIGLHTDNTYFSEPPMIQIFGCLHRCPVSSKGGESDMADGFAVAEMLREAEPALFRALTAIPVVTTYFKEKRAFTACRPVLAVDGRGHVTQVSFNPYDRSPCLAGVAHRAADLDAFYQAYAVFGKLAAANAARFQLEVGDVLFFNNLRMLHARTQYSGPRIMGGAYVGADDVASALVTQSYATVTEAGRTNKGA